MSQPRVLAQQRVVVQLLLPGMKPAALAAWFDVESVAVPIELTPGGLAEALPAILVFRPADPARRPIESRPFIFTAPLGPIELEEIRWYLEEYHLWPVGLFRQRAGRAEQALPGWGKALYDAGLGAAAARDALDAWRAAGGAEARRVSVWVDRDLPDGTPADEQASANEAASALLSLPWELLYHSRGYLLHGGRASHVRRQLPNRESQERQHRAGRGDARGRGDAGRAAGAGGRRRPRQDNGRGRTAAARLVRARALPGAGRPAALRHPALG